LLHVQATMAAQKSVDHRTLDALADQQLMFCNTYHLLLQPGPDVVEEAGGLHKFMGTTCHLLYFYARPTK
jgi:queuine tRNA-ribosyltransferase